MINLPSLVHTPSPLPPVHSKACPRTPVPLVNDEWYNVESMIITPCVPDLIGDTTKPGTSGEQERAKVPFEEKKSMAGWFDPLATFVPEVVKRTAEGNIVLLMLGVLMFDKAATHAIVDGCIPPGMVAKASGKTTSERIGLLKEATILSCSTTLALDNEILRLVKDYGAFEDLAEHRLQGIEMLEALLTNEISKKMHARRFK